MGTPSDPVEGEPRFLLQQGAVSRAEGCTRLTTCRGPNRKCSSSGEEGFAMLPRSRACGAGEGLALDRGQVRGPQPPFSPHFAPSAPLLKPVLTRRLKAYLIF